MQILVVGNDKNIFNENSKLLERILEYSKIVEKYFVVVPNNKSVNINKDNLHIFLENILIDYNKMRKVSFNNTFQIINISM